jgi:hypothetical protein
MRKYKLLCVIIMLFSSQFMIKSNPNIIWEKEIKQTTITLYYALGLFDNELYIWIDGTYPSSNGTFPINNIKTDLYGNIIYNKHIDREIISRMMLPYFYKKSNQIYLRGIWNANKNPARFHQIKILKDGDLENITPDTSIVEYFRQSAYPNSFYDSVYIGAFFSYNEYNQKILVLNDDGEFVREIIPDTTGFNQTIKDNSQQYRLFPTYDRELITTFYSYFDYTHDEYGWNDYAFICKHDLSGNLRWKCKLDNEGYKRIVIYYLNELPDTTYFVIGQVYNSTSDYSLYLAKIDKNGAKLWSKVIKYSKERILLQQRFASLQNGKYFALFGRTLTGTDNNPEASDFWLMIIDNEGNVSEENTWNTNIDNSNILHGAVEKGDGKIFVIGRNTTETFYLAEIEPKFLSDVSLKNIEEEFDISVSPNPSADVLRISINNSNQNYYAKCSIIDITGNEILNFKMQNSYELNTKSINSGTYFIRFELFIETDSPLGTITKKININK